MRAYCKQMLLYLIRFNDLFKFSPDSFAGLVHFFISLLFLQAQRFSRFDCINTINILELY